MTAADLSALWAEIILSIFAMGALLVGAFGGKDRVAAPLVWATAAVMVIIAAVMSTGRGAQELFDGLITIDAFARFLKVAILLSTALVLIMGQNFLARRGILRFEYPILIALASVGMMIMVGAGDLITLYMGLELQSLALYVLAAFRRDSVKSTEAGLKYFVLGALSSGLLLYGASLIYGFSGTTSFAGVIEAVGTTTAPLGLLIGLVFVIVGLAFKISAAPFHMWTPDVYEGAPTPVTAFLATAPKLAAMGVFARVVFDCFGGIVADWQQVVAALSIASLFVGSIAAIGQRNIKRLMAYSSIAHMGFALMGISAGTAFGVEAMLMYMAIYVVMNIGTFAFILSLERDGNPVVDIDALNMLSRTDPGRAIALLILMVSLAGIPPSLGFFGKYYVLNAAVEAGLVWLAVAGVVASVIGAFYYLRIIYYMFFGSQNDEPVGPSSSALLSGILACAALVVILGIINFFGVDDLAAAAAMGLVN